MADFNQAVGLTDDPQDAVNKGLDAQTSASNRQLKLQQDQFDYQKSLQQPFFQGSLPAYYQMVDAITGKRQTYQDPSYTKLEGRDAATEAWARIQKDPTLAGADFWKDLENGKEDPISRIMRDQSLVPLTQGMYKGPDGKVVSESEVPKTTTSAYNPQETDAYKWQQQQMEKNTGRTLRSLGRSNSSYGMNVMADQNRNLASSEYDKQLGRLADLTNIARGGASSLAQASTGFGNQAGQSLSNMGNNAANAALAGGQLAQNGLYNNQQNMFGLANLGLKAYSAYNSGGGGDWTSSGGYNDGSGNSYSASDIEMANSPKQ